MPANPTDQKWNDLAATIGVSLDNDQAEEQRLQAAHERDLQNMVVDQDKLDPAAQQMIDAYRTKQGHQDVDNPGWLAKTLDVPAQVANGFVDAANSIKDLIFDAGTAGAHALYVDGMGVSEADMAAASSKVRQDFGKDIPKPFGAPKSAVGAVTEPVAQFLAPFAAVGKLKYLQMLGKAAPLAQGALTDFIAFNQHQERLSNMVNNVGWGNAVTEYLAAKPEDTWAEGRFKNVLEGVGLVGLTGAVFKGVKYMKDGQAARAMVDAMRQKAGPLAQQIRDAGNEVGTLKDYIGKTLAGEKIDAPAVPAVMPAAPAAQVANPLERYLDVTQRIEGTAKNPKSSAVGPFQFTNGTWLEEARLADPTLKDVPDATVLAMRTDPAQADFVRKVGGSFTQRNVDYLAKNGISNIDEPTMYLAHFLGKDDAVKLLKANDAAPVKSVIEDASIKANPSILRGKTVGEVKAWAQQTWDKRAAQVGASRAPAGAETVVLDGFRPNREQMDLATQARLASANGTTVQDLSAGNVFKRIRDAGIQDQLNRVTQLEEEQFGKTTGAVQDYLKRADAGDANAADEFWRNEGAAFLEVAGHARDAFQDVARAQGFRGNSQAIVTTNEILQRLARANGQSKEDLMRAFAEMSRPEQMESLLQQAGKKTTVNITRDAVHEWYINAILSSPKTQLVDTAGTLLWTPWLALEKVPAGLAGKIRTAWFGGMADRVHADEALVMLKSYMGSVADGFSYVANAMRKGDYGAIGKGLNDVRMDTASRFDDNVGKRAISAENFGIERDSGFGRFVDWAGSAINAPASFMRSKDDVAKAVLYRAEVRALAHRRALSEGLSGPAYEARVNQLMTVPMDKAELKGQTLAGNRLSQIASGLAKGDDTGLVGAAIEDQAKQFAREGTFTNELGPVGSMMQELINKIPGGRVVVPFIKTPTQIMVQFLNRSPLAPVLFKQVRDDIAAGGARADMAMGRMAAGSSLMGLGWYLASAGLITGEGPKNQAEREALMRTGWRPRSIKVGDKYIEYGRLDPLASFLSMPANIVDLSDQFDNDTGADLEKDMSDYTSMGVLGFTNMMMSKTWTQSIAELLDAVNRQDENAVDRMMQYYAASAAVPNAVTFFANQVNPVVQESNSMWDAIQIKAGLTVRPKLDVFGEPVKRDPQLYYGLPSSYSNITSDPLSQKLAAAGAFIARPDRRIEGVELTRDEYNAMMGEMKALGVKEKIGQLINSPIWNQLPDSARSGEEGAQAMTKSGVVNAMYGQFLKAAREITLSKNPDLQARVLRHTQAIQTIPATTPGATRALNAQGIDATGGPVRVDFGLGPNK